LIAALDAPVRREADALIERLAGVPSWVKVGLELFCAEGPSIVSAYAANQSVMLDLKLHDIPETVARATARVASLGAGLLTVHAGGGRAMLEAAVKHRGERMKILAVTVLTSLDDTDLAAIGARGPVAELVKIRTQLAIASGCDGVVASPHEVAAIRTIAPSGFLVVTPGVRPAGSAMGDQKRVMTPHEARAAGADLVVVGRPLRDAPDPAAAARAIVAELA
jgi:orotidine-5'-phosphate decarboxylase